MVHRVLRACSLAVLVVLLAVSAWAQPRPATGVFVSAPFTVAPISGLNCADATTRCVPSEYATIDACADVANAGDTCLIAAGTYAESVSMTRSGTVGSPITFVVSGTVSVSAWTFASTSYVRMIGITVDRDSSFLPCVQYTGTNTGLEFWHNTFRDCGYGISAAALTDRLNNSLVIGNTCLNLGVGDGGGACMVYEGNHSLMAYNTGDNLHPDFFAINGTYNRWLNNYMLNASEASGGHSDMFQFGTHTLGFAYNLIEANFQSGTGLWSDEHVGVIQNYDVTRCTGGVAAGCGAVTENMFRRNVFYHNGSGGIGVSTVCCGMSMTYNRYVFNTEADLNLQNPASGSQYGSVFYSGTQNTFIRNNIAQNVWGASYTTNISVYFVEGSLDWNCNLAHDTDGSVSFTAGWLAQSAAQSNVNPNFVNKAGLDLTLAAGSGDSANARGTGCRLTSTSGSGTGTAITLAAGGGGFFTGSDATELSQYGGALAPGDVITVGTDVVTVVSVAGDVLTVTPSITWANGEGVFYDTDTTPDLGAYPYKAGGYTLSATYVNAAGTVTTTPNDVSLTRFVICYSDGVPYAVDNTSPYTCATPGGTLAVRVYPRYPKTGTLWAVATP